MWQGCKFFHGIYFILWNFSSVQVHYIRSKSFISWSPFFILQQFLCAVQLPWVLCVFYTFFIPLHILQIVFRHNFKSPYWSLEKREGIGSLWHLLPSPPLLSFFSPLILITLWTLKKYTGILWNSEVTKDRAIYQSWQANDQPLE